MREFGNRARKLGPRAPPRASRPHSKLAKTVDLAKQYLKERHGNQFWSSFIKDVSPDSERGRAELSNGVWNTFWVQKIASPGLATFDQAKKWPYIGPLGVKLLNKIKRWNQYYFQGFPLASNTIHLKYTSNI